MYIVILFLWASIYNGPSFSLAPTEAMGITQRHQLEILLYMRRPLELLDLHNACIIVVPFLPSIQALLE